MNPLSLIPLLIATGLFGYFYQQNQLVNGGLLLISLALGITLFKGMFGFAGAYARAFEHRDMSGIFAQIVMLAMATVLFAPILSSGYVYDHEVIGAVAPISASVGIGAFMFGIGMQLGGSCASGSLFVGAGGNRRTLLVLVFFCIGAFIGSLHLSWWQPSSPLLRRAPLATWPLASSRRRYGFWGLTRTSQTSMPRSLKPSRTAVA